MGSSENIAIILLAAGASSRMGDTKQLLPWGKTTLLGHAIQTAKDSAAQSVVVVLGANAKAIRKEIGDYSRDGTPTEEKPSRRNENGDNQAEFVENTDWQSGLGSSISCGIRYIQEKTLVYDAALVVLADQPLIDTEYLNSMMESFVSTQNGIIATAYEKRAGVPALFSQSYFEKLQGLNDDQGAQKIINDPDQAAFVLNPENKTVDIDTKSEYHKLIERLNE
ncbi:MAG: nucleotidyltransferase family protein [Pricia sp.]